VRAARVRRRRGRRDIPRSDSRHAGRSRRGGDGGKARGKAWRAQGGAAVEARGGSVVAPGQRLEAGHARAERPAARGGGQERAERAAEETSRRGWKQKRAAEAGGWTSALERKEWQLEARQLGHLLATCANCLDARKWLLEEVCRRERRSLWSSARRSTWRRLLGAAWRSGAVVEARRGQFKDAR